MTDSRLPPSAKLPILTGSPLKWPFIFDYCWTTEALAVLVAVTIAALSAAWSNGTFFWENV